MSSLKDEVVEMIEVALVELRPFAQPRDLADLNVLLLDARDTDESEQLMSIAEQARSLRAFCESRHQSLVRAPKR